MDADLDAGIGTGWRRVGLTWDDGYAGSTRRAAIIAFTAAAKTNSEDCTTGEGAMGKDDAGSKGEGLREHPDAGDSLEAPRPYSAMRWGNVDFATLSPKRVPTPADILFLVAEYKRTGHIDACAKRANLDYDVAWKVLQEEIRKNPAILESGEVSLSMGLMCREIAMEAVIAARTKLRDPKIKAGDAMWTHKIAIDRAEANFKEYRTHEGDAVSTDSGELDRALQEKEEELARLREASSGATPSAEAESPASAGSVPEDLGKDN